MQHYYYVSGVIALSAAGGIVLLVSIVVFSFVMLRYLLHYVIKIIWMCIVFDMQRIKLCNSILKLNENVI